ncbi:MAG: hypothetical protein AB8B53_05845 [Flavobacteriales bacterium]
MKISLTCALIFLTIAILTSCDRPECINENPIFLAHEPDSKIYKDELVKQLKQKDQNELRFWLQKYDIQDGIESLYFHVQSKDLCAILHLTVKDWQKLEDVKERKGVGRRGAEFTNLQFKILEDDLKTTFEYITFDSILD